MLWQEDSGADHQAVGKDMVDVAFRLAGGTMPVAHAHALYRAVIAELPWLAREPRSGIHQIHVAASGNGWMRPDPDDCEVLNLSRRTRLMLRVPRERLADAEHLIGRDLDVSGHRLQVGQASARPLTASGTLFARYVMCADAAHEEEERFVDWVVDALEAMGIRPKKLLCGMTSFIEVPGERLRARSLMVAALPPAASLELQRRGLGEGRLMGCGLFVHHKGIEPVREGDGESG